jgi:hypothetical protein
MPVVSTSVQSGSVVFRIVAVNPSREKTQRTDAKTFLPQEIKPKDILDLGGLELEYDPEKSIYYVYNPSLELAPAEVRVFEVEVQDVWLIPQKKLDDLKKRTDLMLERLQDTDYYEKAKEIADTIYPRLDEITTTQVDEAVSRAQHIGIYRTNLLTLDQIKEDMNKMERLLSVAGRPLAPEMLTKTKIKAESPTKTMTWIVIFIIIVFIGLLAGVLFFTWNRQTRITREEILAAKKAAFPGSQEEDSSRETPENQS